MEADKKGPQMLRDQDTGHSQRISEMQARSLQQWSSPYRNGEISDNGEGASISSVHSLEKKRGTSPILEAASFSEAKAQFQRQLQKQAADHASAIMKVQQESFQQQQALRQRLISRYEHQVQSAHQGNLAELESERMARRRVEERLEGEGLLLQQLQQRMQAERSALVSEEKTERTRANRRNEELQAELQATQEALENATKRAGKAEATGEAAVVAAAEEAAKRTEAEAERGRMEESSAAFVAASTEEAERLLDAVMEARAEADTHANDSTGARAELAIFNERVHQGEAVAEAAAEAAARERTKRAMLTFMLAGSRSKCQRTTARCKEAEQIANAVMREAEAERAEARTLEATTSLRQVLSGELQELQRAWSVAEGEWRLEYDRAASQSMSLQKQLTTQMEEAMQMERAMQAAKEDRDISNERAETAEAAARAAEERVEVELGGIGRERGELHAQQRTVSLEADDAREEARVLRKQVRELQAHVDGVTGALGAHESSAMPETHSPIRLAEAVARARASAEEATVQLEVRRMEQNSLEQQLVEERGACDELRRRCEQMGAMVEARQVEEEQVRSAINHLLVLSHSRCLILVTAPLFRFTATLRTIQASWKCPGE
jgi:hypothetical protein